MNNKVDVLNNIIRQRRSVFPKFFSDKVVPDLIIMEMLENANWAPTHKRTEPWRFKVFKGAGLEKLSLFLADYYKQNIPAHLYLEKKYLKTRHNPLRSAAVIAICMQRDLEVSLPEWEEIAAVACAVQNLWLTGWAHGVGGYWSTPKAIEEMGTFLSLAPGEKCLGLFYMGYFEKHETKGSRSPVDPKITWVVD